VFPSKDGCTSYLRPMLLDVFKMHMWLVLLFFCWLIVCPPCMTHKM
jgi:hypothetical protein